MIRRVLFGLISGGFVGLLAVAVASKVFPPLELTLPAPEAIEVTVPAGSEFNAERVDEAPVIPQTDSAPSGGDSPIVSAPDRAEAPAPDTTSVDTPESSEAEGPLNAPGEGEAPVVTAITEESSPAGAVATGLSEPSVDATPEPVAPLTTPDTSVQNEEIALAAPEAGQAPVVAGNDEPAVPAAGASDALDQPNVDVAPASEASAAAPVTPDTGGETVAIAPPAPEPDASPAPTVPNPTPVEPALDAGPETEAAPETPDAPAPAVVEPDPDPAPAPAPAPPEPPAAAPAEVAQDPGSSELTRPPTPVFESFTPNVTTNRLPRIGAEAEEAAPAPDPAITRNAQPFENADAVPMVALVLLDDPSVDAAALADLGVPLTVAIDPLADGAGDRMAALRGVGAEIAVLTPLPDGAAPADVEVAFQVYLDAVPDAVVVMDVPSVALQQNRPRAAQVIDILKATGHGLVTYEKGLNTGLRLAEGAEVPAATVFRIFDDGERDGAAMKRFLDQGAFRAGQVGPVILQGNVTPETLQAIMEWVAGSRAATIALAPVSAVLMAQP